jgi:hypothetical protein
MKQIIHVAQDAIRRNAKNGTNEPAIIIRDHRWSRRVHEIELQTPDGKVIGKMIYSPHKPLSCGARLWIELDTEICSAVPC